MPARHSGRDDQRVEYLVDAATDDRTLLREEVERLRQRVDDLELTVAEYRSQMSQIVGSASWRVTSPIRATASRVRNAKVRARRAAKRVRVARSQRNAIPVVGLLPLPDANFPESSPLRGPADITDLRRPRSADGPVRRPAGSPTVAVVAHVYYAELWGDIDDRLSRMPEDFDLIVTVTEGAAEVAIPLIRARHRNVRIEVVPNRGRDWAPLMHLLNIGLLSGYDAVAKVHTKKSEHRIDGDGWRLALLDGIFESPDQIGRILALLREDRDVGVVVPTGQVSGTEHWGSDQPIVEALAARLPMAFDPEALRFPAGSMFWCRPWLLERFADLDISVEDFEPEAGQYDATTAHALERLVGIFVNVAGMDLVEVMDVKGRLAACRKSGPARPKVYAFYLPQYHPIPENDEFWGAGFTDWVNVQKARPLFKGHLQPILPSKELGFYDLRDPEVLRRQAGLARDYGVDGLVFHHYWFDGKAVLDCPLRNWMADPTIDLPLALCWANEPWTRRWDGQEDDVLIPQTYTEGWAERFWADISPVLADRRYIRMDGAPLLVLYRPGLIPDVVEAIRTWRRLAYAAGHPAVFIAGVRPSRETPPLARDVTDALDALISFPPGNDIRIESVRQLVPEPCAVVDGDVMSYSVYYDVDVPAVARTHTLFPGVMPGWDNTARRGTSAYLFLGANPVSFAGALRDCAARMRKGPEAPTLFVNAWNEWAEGAMIEPSTRFGRSNLASVLDVFPVGGRNP